MSMLNIEQILKETKARLREQQLKEEEHWQKIDMQSVEDTLNNIRKIDERIDALWKDAKNV